MIHQAQTFLFRWRGGLMAAVALVVLVFGCPGPLSCAVGIVLGILGEGLRFWSIGFSRGHTRGLTVEAPFLATGGPYAYTRNPLYLGNVLNAMGVTIACVGLCTFERTLCLLMLTAVSLLVVYGGIIPLEERHLEVVHGDQFRQYKRDVSRFIPSRTPSGVPDGSFCLDSALYFERWSLAWWALTWLYLFGVSVLG